MYYINFLSDTNSNVINQNLIYSKPPIDKHFMMKYVKNYSNISDGISNVFSKLLLFK